MTAFALLSLGHAGSARAVGIETLLMPGKVSNAHVKYETECSLCHDRADRDRQTGLCLDCHKDTAADISAKTGWHGRMANSTTSQCKSCHSEHMGRDGDIIKFDRTAFDHKGTDFTLDGAHRGLACDSCHETGKKYSKAQAACFSCHKKNDVHKGQMGEKCVDCHTTLTWSGGKYDHSKTKFALEKKHLEVACNACHIGGRYKDTPLRCVSCHMPDDVHKNSRGEKCGECHTTESWKSAKFDHEKETHFALLGKHASLECGNCHKAGDFKDKPPKECAGCHRADDTHALRFGEKCGDCHGNEVWKQKGYDHAAKHKFALAGAHEKLNCHACHTAVAKNQKLGTECESCHRPEDPHGGKLGRDCAACHGVVGWKTDIRFDHDLTDYPLLGLHVVVGCGQCHASKAFKGAAKECVGCHKQNDVHKGGLGDKCADCHSPNGWRLWDFDHAVQAKFPLTGAHSKLKCADCHRQPAGIVKLGKDCAACHRKDDIHLGQYGTQCQRCHTSITFKGARIQ